MIIFWRKRIKIWSIHSSGIKRCSLVEVYRHFGRTYNYLNPNLIEIHSEAGDRDTRSSHYEFIKFSFEECTKTGMERLTWQTAESYLRGPFCSEEVESYLGSSVTVLLLVTGWTSTHGYWSCAGHHTVFLSVALTKCKPAHFQICLEPQVSPISIVL
jgi:hypothetical protein